MDLSSLAYGLGSTGLFASRAFTPAFLTALFLRYGHHIPVLSQHEIFQNASQTPTWFTHGGVIAVLGVLALLEILATKNPDAEELLQEVDKFLKATMAIVSYLGIMSVAERTFIEETLEQTQRAGMLDSAVALLIGGVVFGLAYLRGTMLSEWMDIDEDDDLGIRQLFSWLEDIWATFGVLVLLLFPVVMLLLLAIVSGLLVALRVLLERREEKHKISCGSCGERIYSSALACPSCGEAVENPHQVGILGQPKAELVHDRDHHAMQLIARKRCPVCATRLKQRLPEVTCEACGHQLFEDEDEQRRYLQAVSRKLPATLGICTGLSLIPIIGLIPGIIVYRLVLVAPFRRYLPRGRRFCLKWLIRLFFFVLIALQWIPAIGGIVVPAMAITSYWLHRSSFMAVTGIQNDAAAGPPE